MADEPKGPNAEGRPKGPNSRRGGPRESSKPKCTGHRSTDGEPCTKYPMKGQKVCETHGGKAPQNKAAGKQKVELATAQEKVSKLNLRREVDARRVLEEEVWRCAGIVAYLDEQVQALREQEMVWGVTEQVTRDSGEFPGTDTTYSATLNVWVKWWQQERAAAAKVSKMAMDAGVEERRVRLAEQQGALLSDVIKRILADLGLTAEQQQRAPEVVVRHLRAIAESVTPDCSMN